MRIMFVVAHPAHVHLFRNAISILEEHGNKIGIAAVAKEINLKLLDAYGLEYNLIGESVVGLHKKVFTMLQKNLRLLKICKEFKPDLLVSTGSPYAAQVSKLLRKPHIAFGDTEIATGTTMLILPFTDAICTPSCFSVDLGKKHIRYDGYHELAYLHPNYFSEERAAVSALTELQLPPTEKIILTRFSSWDSSHDIGDRGFNFKSKGETLRFLKELSRYGRVFLTSEVNLDEETHKYTPRIPIEKIHNLLAVATLYIGEGATMASEAGVLGVPWIFVSTRGRSYLDEQEKKYGLGYTISDRKKAVEKAIALLEQNDLRIRWQKKRQKLLNEKIDVTRFFVEFIENWPESFEKLKDEK